jgi:type I restriction enzyme S subunit
MSNIPKTELAKLEIPVPPLALQQEFAAFVRQVDKLKADTQLAIDKLQMLYDSLAQEYFSIE